MDNKLRVGGSIISTDYKVFLKLKSRGLDSKLVVDLEIRLMIKVKLKCLCEFFRISKEIDNGYLTPVVLFF